MAYKTPTEIADQYLRHVKSLKAEVDISNEDSDWWVRSRVVGGVIAGVYADQKRISDDVFPQSARRDAIERHLQTYFDDGFTQPTRASGTVKVTGATGSSLSLGAEMEYEPNGNTYVTTEALDLGSSTAGNVAVRSISTGQDQNLLADAELSLSSPPAGFDSIATVQSPGITDGRDVETTAAAAERILRQIRTPEAGGKESDYETFAEDADDAVTSASIIRFPNGFGTVGIVITAGTTDIDTAIDNGDAINQLPSTGLVQTVQDYIDTQKPITDCPIVYSPASVPIDVTVTVRFSSGDKDTTNSGFTLTQGELVEREVKRAIYKTPAGGRKFGSSGYVVASQIEEVIDQNLSADPFAVGAKAQIVTDRQVDNLTASGPNRSLTATQIAVPGTITINEF